MTHPDYARPLLLEPVLERAENHAANLLLHRTLPNTHPDRTALIKGSLVGIGHCRIIADGRHLIHLN